MKISVADFSAAFGASVFKFCKKLDGDKLYCVVKTATYSLSVPLFVHFSFSPVKTVSHISQLLLELVFSNLVQSLLEMSCIV